MSEQDLRLVQIPQGGTRLLERPEIREVLTAVVETDSRTALTRGLKEYLEQLSIVWVDGVERRFLRVMQTWSEPEVPKDFPAAVVYSQEAGQYEARDLSVGKGYLPETKTLIRTPSELSLGLTVEVWASDPIERMALCAMLERAFDPVDWMAGFRLVLPHYHGAHAHFEKTNMVYTDGSDSAMKRWRLAVFNLNSNVTQYVVDGEVPKMDVRVAVDAYSGDS